MTFGHGRQRCYVLWRGEPGDSRRSGERGCQVCRQSATMRPTMKLLLFLALFTTLSLAQEPERIRDVIYTKHDGVALTMDIFKPEKPNGAGIIKISSQGVGHM